ncbi:acetoacetate decarboxylase [Methylobacterium soli]|uniref:Acetoacetate decarboxylase n=2 Tax=Methylobacterium soli TaxID=553447 RepID=A0A6L3SUT2_9HYPH|nr:acetoacetate decarboxylase [Methylobacterium soli]
MINDSTQGRWHVLLAQFDVICRRFNKEHVIAMVAESTAWLTSPDGVSYPPAPWRLHGTAYVSLWQVRASALPADWLPQDLRPVTMLGRVLVGTAFAVYEPSGDLAYNEVLAAVQVHGSGRPSLTVPFIWVDHPASIAGARAMWSIPKQEAAFRIRQPRDAEDPRFRASAETPDEQPIADLLFRSRTSMPGRWPVRTAIVQTSLMGSGGGDLRITPAQAWARVSFGTATWDFGRQSPFSFLRGRNPFVSVRLTEMSLHFGSS